MSIAGIARSQAVLRRAILAALFLLVAMSKLFAPAGAGHSVTGLLRSPVLLWIVVALELAIAAALLSRWWRLAAWATVAFAIGAVVYLTILRIQGIDISSCGCLGPRRLDLGPHLMLLAGALILASTALLSPEPAHG